MVLGALSNFGNWAEDQAQKVGIGDGGEWEEIPVEEDPAAPAPAPTAAQPAPSAEPAPTPAPAPEDVGIVYSELPNGTEYGVYQGATADWQKVGPSPNQLEAAEQTGQPIQGNAPRTQEAADQLNSVRPATEPQEVVVEDPTPTTELPPVEVQPAEDNLFYRYTPFDEVADAVKAEDGVLGKAGAVLTGLGAFANQQKERNVQSIGDRALRDLTTQDDATLDRRFLGEQGGRSLDPMLNSIIGGVKAGTEAYQTLKETGDPLDALGAAASTGLNEIFTEPLQAAVDVTYEEFLYDPANRQAIRDIAVNGYRDLTGGAATWQYYQDQTTGDGVGGSLKRGLRDVLYDPTVPETIVLGGIGSAGGATSKVARAAEIAIDPLGEAIGAVPKAIRTIPGASGLVTKVADSPLNLFKLTDDAQNKIKLDEAVTQGEALGKQIDQIGTYTGIPETPSLAGRSRTGEIFVRDSTTGVVRPFNIANPMAEFQAADKVLSQMPYADYGRMLNTSGGGGIRWFDLLFHGDTLGLPKFYDNALPSNPVEHERYIDLFIKRIDAREAAAPGVGGQEVIDGLYQDIKHHAFGGRRYPRSKVDPHLAMYRINGVRRILDKGGFVDTNAANNIRIARDIRRQTFRVAPRRGTPAYRPPTAPFVYNTPRPTTPVLGSGSWDRGLIFTPEDEAILRQDIDGRELGKVVAELKTSLTTARDLVSRMTAGTPLSITDQRTLDKLTKQFGDRYGLIRDPALFGTLTPDQINALAARGARWELEIKLGMRTSAGKIVQPKRLSIGGFKPGEAYDKASDFAKTWTLLNIANIVPFTVRQVIGNASTLGIANRKAAIDYLTSPGNSKAILNRERQGLLSTVRTDVDTLREAAGLGSSNRIRQSSRTGTLQALTVTEERNRASKFFSPETMRILSQVSDLQVRESLYKTTFEPAFARLRSTIQNYAFDRASGFMVDVTPAQVQAVFDALPNVFSPIELRSALEASGAVSRRGSAQDVADWADRVARDYLGAKANTGGMTFDGLREIDRAALKEMERVGFTFNETKLDQIANKFFFYHYWTSRAGLLYTREMLRNPAMQAGYYRMMESLTQEAEQNNYPPYLKGWLQFASTPLGFTSFMNPAVFWNTMLTFSQESFSDPGDDMRSMTELGRQVDRSPFMVNPILTTMLYWSGMLGADANGPNTLGLDAIARQATNLVNLYKTSKGEKPLPGFVGRPTSWLNNHFANLLSGAMQGLGLPTDLQQRVPLANYDATFETNKNWFVQQVLREQHKDDGWSDQLIADAAAAIQDDWNDDVVKEAVRRVGQMPYQQPTFGVDGGSLPGRAIGLGMNILQPTYITTRPTTKENNQNIRTQLRENKGTPADGYYLDPADGKWKAKTGFEYDLNNVAQSSGPEDIRFEKTVDQYSNLGTQEQEKTQNTYNAILNGMAPAALMVGDLTFTPADVAAMDVDTRKQLAKVYLTEQGTWDDLQALWNAKDAYKAANPELDGYFAFQDNAENYPGGVEAWAQQQIKLNPEYARFVASQERLFPDKSAEAVAEAERKNPANGQPRDARNNMLTDPDAYRLVSNKPATIYDNQNPAPSGAYGPAIAGVAAGLTPLQMKDLGSGGDTEGSSGSGASFADDKRQTLEQDLTNFFGMAALMDAYDQQVGYAPKTSVNRYLQRVQGDKTVKLDTALYDQIKGAYDYVFPSKGDLGDFLTWASDPTLNPTGAFDLDGYIDYSSIEYARQQLLKPTGGKAPSNISELLGTGTSVAGADGSGKSMSRQLQQISVFNWARLQTDPMPNAAVMGEIPPGLPLTWMGERQGWVMVQTPDGRTGWLPSSAVMGKRPAA